MCIILKPGPNLHQCLWTCLQARGPKGLAAMLTSMQSAGAAPEVSLRITQVRKHAKRDPPMALKLRAQDITRSPRHGYQWPREKDLCPPKILEKKILYLIDNSTHTEV